MATHHRRIKFASELLSAPELLGWTYRRDDDDQVVVSGPCPSCGGEVYGPDSPDPGDITDADPTTLLTGDGRLDVIATVYVRCNCGAPHGVVGGYSCGRYWIVEVA